MVTLNLFFYVQFFLYMSIFFFTFKMTKITQTDYKIVIQELDLPTVTQEKDE